MAISKYSNGYWSNWSVYKVKGEDGVDGKDGLWGETKVMYYCVPKKSSAVSSDKWSR